MAYVLLLEDIDRSTTAQIQAALIGRAMGNEVDVPDSTEIRIRFDQMLRAEPVGVGGAPTSRTEILREAFGLTGGSI